MTILPRQNWTAYEVRAKPIDEAVLREMTPEEKFEQYEDLFEIVSAPRQVSGDWARLERWEWEQKVAARLRQVAAFQKLDQRYRGQNAANHSG